MLRVAQADIRLGATARLTQNIQDRICLQHSPSNRGILLRTFGVLSLAALVLAFSLPDMRRVWQPEGGVGYVRDDDNVISASYPDSPASRAGLDVGERIWIAATKPDLGSWSRSGGTSLPWTACC